MTLLLTFKTSVVCCARCQQDHPDLEFRELNNPGEIKASHWALCPTNGQPILLRISKDGAKRVNIPKSDPRIGAAFDRFWNAYPRKIAKPHAFSSFTSDMVDKIEDILEAIRIQRTMPAWTKDNGQFIPHPATWLRARRWEDQMHAVNPPARQLRTAAGQSVADIRNRK
jgi:hypothetical protein